MSLWSLPSLSFDKFYSTELDKSYEALMHSSRQADNSKSHSRSPRNSYRNLPQSVATGNGTHTSKLPPTGPRIHKKPRISEPHLSPARSNAPLPSQKVYTHSHIPASRGSETREHVPRYSTDNRGGKPNHIMEVDEDTRSRISGPPADRERPRERERDRDHERDRGPKERPRDRDRDRDRNRSIPRRNNFSSSGRGAGGGSSRRVDRVTVPNSFPSPDRTLAERMGLWGFFHLLISYYDHYYFLERTQLSSHHTKRAQSISYLLCSIYPVRLFLFAICKCCSSSWLTHPHSCIIRPFCYRFFAVHIIMLKKFTFFAVAMNEPLWITSTCLIYLIFWQNYRHCYCRGKGNCNNSRCTTVNY